MKKSSLVLNVSMAALLVAGSAGLGHAGDLKVSGFADITWALANDQPTVEDPNGAAPGAKNAIEQKFLAKGEIDFEKEQDGVTFRLDLDFPSNSESTLLSCDQGVNGLINCGGNSFGGSGLEQAKFDWALPGAPMNLNLTGGIFNSPFGYESQDAPDRQFITYGQLFSLVPSNMAGIVIGGSQGQLSASLVYTDEWRSVTTAEENSFGIVVGFDASAAAKISLGFLTSDQGNAAGLNQDEDLIDFIVSGVSPMGSGAELNYALEYIADENNTAFALTVGATHGHHALTLRYDSVDCDKGSAFCNGLGVGPGAKSITPTSLTLSAACELAETLTAKLEYVTYDSDKASAPGTPAPDADMILLQFVATLN